MLPKRARRPSGSVRDVTIKRFPMRCTIELTSIFLHGGKSTPMGERDA